MSLSLEEEDEGYSSEFYPLCRLVLGRMMYVLFKCPNVIVPKD